MSRYLYEIEGFSVIVVGPGGVAATIRNKATGVRYMLSKNGIYPGRGGMVAGLKVGMGLAFEVKRLLLGEDVPGWSCDLYEGEGQPQSVPVRHVGGESVFWCQSCSLARVERDGEVCDACLRSAHGRATGDNCKCEICAGK